MDINGDGFKDIFSGSYAKSGPNNTMVGLFQVLYGKKDGSFAKVTPLNGTDNKPLIIPAKDRSDSQKSICTRPMAVDWDSDDDLDLVVGNFAGTFYLFTGHGDGKFDPVPAVMNSTEGPLQIAGVHSDPFVVDWDGDGDNDILSGSAQGGVQWAENTAGREQTPVLLPFRDLIATKTAGQKFHDPTVFNRTTIENMSAPAMSTRIWVADLNGDDKLDILVGDGTTLIKEKEGLSADEFEKQYKEWAEIFAGIRKEMMAITDYQSPEARPIQMRMQTHWQKRENLVTEQRTGFVWAYLQK